LVRAPRLHGKSVCDGISSDVGGCTAVRHTFTGSTCQAIGVEWADVIDEAIVAILDGPEAVDGDARSVRLQQAAVITTVDMNAHLRDLERDPACAASPIPPTGASSSGRMTGGGRTLL
jgi:hypothetical protein